MTKQEQIELRDMTYEGPLVPPLRCENCKHGWFHFSNQCHAVAIRGEIKLKTVHPLGYCALYERKPTA